MTKTSSALSPALMARVYALLANGGSRLPDLATRLRETCAGTRFAICDSDDIPSRLAPLAQGDGFALYGIDARAHCASLTADPSVASGLAIALMTEDEDD